MYHYNDGSLHVRMASWLCEKYGKLYIIFLLFYIYIYKTYF